MNVIETAKIIAARIRFLEPPLAGLVVGLCVRRWTLTLRRRSGSAARCGRREGLRQSNDVARSRRVMQRGGQRSMYKVWHDCYVSS
jgi:hypothetical protein